MERLTPINEIERIISDLCEQKKIIGKCDIN